MSSFLFNLQPVSKGLLQRVLLNLCAHSVTRGILIGFLIDMVRSEVDGPGNSSTTTTQRLYGCQWNVVYARPQSSNGAFSYNLLLTSIFILIVGLNMFSFCVSGKVFLPLFPGDFWRF